MVATIKGKEEMRLFSLQEMPWFAVTIALFTFGPMRGSCYAELAVYHCCVQKKDLTANEIQAITRWQIGGPTDLLVGTLFSRDNAFVEEFSRFYIGLTLSGVVDVWDLLVHFVGIFCLAKEERLRLDILPRRWKAQVRSGRSNWSSTQAPAAAAAVAV